MGFATFANLIKLLIKQNNIPKGQLNWNMLLDDIFKYDNKEIQEKYNKKNNFRQKLFLSSFIFCQFLNK